MDELDPGAKRRLLGDLRQLQSLLDDSDDDFRRETGLL